MYSSGFALRLEIELAILAAFSTGSPLQGIYYIHKVKSVQGIEMNYMVMLEKHGQHKIADICGTGRNRLCLWHLQGREWRQARENRVHTPHVRWVKCGRQCDRDPENYLQPAKKSADATGFLDSARFRPLPQSANDPLSW